MVHDELFERLLEAVCGEGWKQNVHNWMGTYMCRESKVHCVLTSESRDTSWLEIMG